MSLMECRRGIAVVGSVASAAVPTIYSAGLRHRYHLAVTAAPPAAAAALVGTPPHSCWLSCAVASIHPRTLQRLCTPRRASGERKLNKCPKWRDKWPHRRRAPTYVNVTCTFTLIRVLSTAKPPKIAPSGVRSGLSSNTRFLRPTRVCPLTASQPVQLARV